VRDLPSAQVRDFVYRYWLDAVRTAGGAGDLVWMIASTMDNGERYPDYDRFTLYGHSDAPSIRAHALAMSGATEPPALPRIDPPPDDEGAVNLWVVDADGNFVDDAGAVVTIRRSDRQLGDPIPLDFSGGPVELHIPAYPAGPTTIEVTAPKYRTASSGFFDLAPQTRVFLEVHLSGSE
jgi:hypothetical protein